MRHRFPALAATLLIGGTTLNLAHAQQASQRASQQAKPAASTTATVTLPPGVTRVTEVEGITEYRLAKNGLRVLLFPDQSEQAATVNITYLVGSRNEGYGETGMAHLLEHLMFKGSTAHPNVPKELSDHGARPNGTTSDDRTNYFETFRASDENFDWALSLESDRMVHSFIARKDLDSEMSVVRNEYESGENNPANILSERIAETAFIWHNYGHPTIGARSDIEKVPITRLQAFYHTYYQPDNSVLTVAGKFDPAKTLALIAQKFGAIPKPTRVLQDTYTEEPTQDGERSVTLRRAGDVASLGVAYHTPSGAHPDSPAVEMLASILSDTPAGRLHKTLVETKLASSIGGGAATNKDPNLMTFSATIPDVKNVDAARAALLQTIDDIASGKNPPTDAELARVKNAYISGYDQFLNKSDSVGLGLSEFIAQGDWRLLFVERDRLKAVTVADVQRVAKAYLKPDNRTVGVFLPTKTPDRAAIPATPDLVAMMKDFKGSAARSEGEVFNPSPANIDKRTLVGTAGPLKTALLPKKTRGNTVTLTMTLHIGNLDALQNKCEVAGLTGAMLMRGSQKYTRQQIGEELDKIKAQGSVSGGATTINLEISTTRPNLPAAFRLLSEVLREPAFTPTEFDSLKTVEITGIEQSKGEPQSIAGNALARYLSPYPASDPRYTPTPDEREAAIKAVTLDQVKQFYADFYGAGSGELAVVGDFDPAEVSKLAGDLYAGWTPKTTYARIATPFVPVAGKTESFPTPDKANAFALLSEPFALRDDSPDYPALLIGNEIIGGGFLNSRLATRIRQKDGVSYGVGSFVAADAQDTRGRFIAYGIFNPTNAAKFETGLREEMARVVKDGVTQAEVDAAKKGYLQEQEVSRAKDGELVGGLRSDLYLGRTMAFSAARDAQIAALTADQVNAALRKYIDPSKFVLVKAGDFK